MFTGKAFSSQKQQKMKREKYDIQKKKKKSYKLKVPSLYQILSFHGNMPKIKPMEQITFVSYNLQPLFVGSHENQIFKLINLCKQHHLILLMFSLKNFISLLQCNREHRIYCFLLLSLLFTRLKDVIAIPLKLVASIYRVVIN